MGQIKNIKLHIVTDIKNVTSRQRKDATLMRRKRHGKRMYISRNDDLDDSQSCCTTRRSYVHNRDDDSRRQVHEQLSAARERPNLYICFWFCEHYPSAC